MSRYWNHQERRTLTAFQENRNWIGWTFGGTKDQGKSLSHKKKWRRRKSLEKRKWLKEVPELRRRTLRRETTETGDIENSRPLVRATDENHVGYRYTKLDAVGQLRLNNSLETGVQIARDDSRFRFYRFFCLRRNFSSNLKIVILGGYEGRPA